VNTGLLSIGLLCCTFLCLADDDMNYNAIAKRLRPEGIVDILGKIKIVETKIVDEARPPLGGNEIFQQHCIICHGSGVAGAPKFGSASDWAPRKAKGLPTLLHHAQTGFNFMPAKGNCTDCSKEELEDAINYMISKSS
jgi:cytochrome c5